MNAIEIEVKPLKKPGKLCSCETGRQVQARVDITYPTAQKLAWTKYRYATFTVCGQCINDTIDANITFLNKLRQEIIKEG